ncbi:HAD family hydrolase [Sutcliffiella halmapala]|uniref:HAD family hydrolase n=1 Tax=Sutcliffiella halmapala TaxID=79882 RepID=UPI000995D586|nr:HAD family hydrolase [Sutcliffiella halmapala]
MENITTIVFDLDGTLYEDTHHFRYYADLLRNKLSMDVQELFEQDYLAVEDGSHTLKIGRVYDAQKDLILSHHHGEVTQGWKWDGEIVPSHEIKELYPKPLQFDLVETLSIGDLWWIPVAIAKHYGLSSKEAYEAFLQTREHMMTDDFELQPLKEFADVLERLHSKYTLVLMTNSPQVDSETIIKKLGFTSYFHDKIFEANKPIHTGEKLTFISEKWTVPFSQMLSIGDNYINEILPASLLGCSTICIDPYDIHENSVANYTVRNLNELSIKLEKLLLDNTEI